LGLYLGAHCDQRASGRAPRTRYRSLVDEGHCTSAGAAIRRHQHLILVAGRGTGRRLAACANHPQRPRRRCRRARRSGRARLPFRTWWARRTRRARRTWIALLARWTGDAGFSFWSRAALATARQSKGERNEKRHPVCWHVLGSIHDGARSGGATMCCYAPQRKACRACAMERGPGEAVTGASAPMGSLGGSGAFRERHRIMVRRAVWFPPRRADVMRIKRMALTSRTEAKQVFSSVASTASGRMTE
jgi:hypothetical protein